MHEDASGIDNGAYGLRLRPVDMQKFGILYLNEGRWDGRQLISSDWVRRSFSPWIASQGKEIDYGWHWWNNVWSPAWISHGAVGWKGQRIEVFPQQGLVVTMTGMIGDGSEVKVFSDIIHKFVMHSLDPLPESNDIPTLKAKLKAELASLRVSPSRIPPHSENRMIPTVALKEKHFPYHEEEK